MSRGGDYHSDNEWAPTEVTSRDKVADQEVLVARLRRNRGSRLALLALVNYDPPPEARRLIAQLASCGRQHRCGLMSCPYCGRRAQRYEVRRAIKDFYARIGGQAHREAITFVTIKPAALDRVSLRTSAQKLKKRIRYLQRQRLPSTAWSGFLEVGLVNADVHLHVVIYHPDLSRSALQRAIEDEFSEDREVSFSQWREDQSMFAASLKVFEYSTKHLPSMKGMRDHMASASRLFGHYVVNRQRLSQDFVGVRFKINMRSDLRWRAGVLTGPDGALFVDTEMEEFIWSVRRNHRRQGH